MKRGGFTMIELIFVIVILGILAAVAIPKLAATRDDAKVSKALSEVSTLVGELGAYYTANGQFSGTLTDMTNVQDVNYTTAFNNGSGTITYYTPDNSGNDEACVTLDVNNTGGTLTVAAAAGASGNVCTGLQSASVFTSDLVGTKQFGGSRVSF